jgi:peptide subunit release factor 1 (eRF1)
MELKTLKEHIRTLASLPETEAPVISCYLLLENGRMKERNAFEERFRDIKSILPSQTRHDFEGAMDVIRKYLAEELKPEAKGIAIFARAGNKPFFLPLEFSVPLPNWIAADRVPNIYQLIELKDTYHRYVVMLGTKESVRILEINLGSVTKELWETRSGLRQRVGQQWTKEHYQNHKKDWSRKFVNEKIKTIERLMSAGGYAHLILAGHPTNIGLIRKELPPRLADKLIDIIPASSKTSTSSVVESSIAVFIEAEEKESRTIAKTLLWQVQTGGLAVAGSGPSYLALKRGQVDTLVLGKSYCPCQAWVCNICDLMGHERGKPITCPTCGATDLKDIDIKEEMVRLAEQHGCSVEVVNKSEDLMQLGGVGCLLRYRQPVDYA